MNVQVAYVTDHRTPLIGFPFCAFADPSSSLSKANTAIVMVLLSFEGPEGKPLL
jgi:hypothetical protein